MMFPIRNVEDLQNLNEAVSLQNQVKVVRLQDKLSKQNFHEDMTKVFEPLTDTLKKTSENITKTITENSINNNKAIEKSIKGKYHIRNYLKDFFGFAEHQENGTYGLGYKLTLTKNTDNAVLNNDNAVANGRVKINSLDWYVPHYSANLEEYNKLMNQIKKNSPTLLHYPEISVFMKEVNT